MARLEMEFLSDFDDLLKRIEDGILNASISATLEDSCDWQTPAARCSVRVFERYSYAGNNRVSMSVTLFQSDGMTKLCAITSGGSQAVFWKLNTWGEEAFLETLVKILK